ncbi:MAG TPA: uroporphyrinogen decarboxylase family protein [Thermodesulfobacteriota bacterium]|nr:uroporphyrinogen decarboxylase family protein [Thermodesulfobacteriota bacterium]
MTSKERVLAALKRKQPDRVPWVESSVHNKLAEKLLQRSDFEKATVTQLFSVPGARIPSAVLEVLALDNLNFSVAPPRFVKSQNFEGMDIIVDGLIKTEADLKRIVLPDPESDAFYQPARDFVSRYRGSDKALGITTRMGISNTYLSMGIEHFSLMLYENPAFLLKLLDMFIDWACKAVPRINELGFDFMIVPEDLAWKQGPMFSPKMIHELFLPRMKKVAEKIRIPWIYHSDGNLMPILDDLLTLGMSGIANIEPNAMDIAELKKKYGHRVCLVGNIDLHYTLTRGTPEETEAEVKKRIQEVGRGGGYILASSNSLTGYCKPENVLAMNRALLKYGNY